MDTTLKEALDNPKVVFQVGVSGGKDSTAALAWLLRYSGVPSDRILVTFCDTGNEHEWTYEMIQWINDNLHPVETIRSHRDYTEWAIHKKRFPSVRVRYCTELLKIVPAQKYVQALRDSGRIPVAVSGVRADESAARRDLPKWDLNGFTLCREFRPLLDWTYQQVLEFHAKECLPLNKLYAAGARRVGCWPCFMCVKKEVRTIALKFPERIAQVREMERKVSEVSNCGTSTFFARDKVPPRFRTKEVVAKDGTKMMTCTIDDVARWSLTGRRAQGTWEDNPEPETGGCNSGYCE